MAFNKNTNELTECTKDSEEVYRSSVETAFSLSTELLPETSSYPSKPRAHCHLFTHPSEQVEENYCKIFAKLEETIKELEDLTLGVNIRDDCSFQPKQVLLRIPKRRHTSISY